MATLKSSLILRSPYHQQCPSGLDSSALGHGWKSFDWFGSFWESSTPDLSCFARLALAVMNCPRFGFIIKNKDGCILRVRLFHIFTSTKTNLGAMFRISGFVAIRPILGVLFDSICLALLLGSTRRGLSFLDGQHVSFHRYALQIHGQESPPLRIGRTGQGSRS